MIKNITALRPNKLILEFEDNSIKIVNLPEYVEDIKENSEVLFIKEDGVVYINGTKVLISSIIN